MRGNRGHDRVANEPRSCGDRARIARRSGHDRTAIIVHDRHLDVCVPFDGHHRVEMHQMCPRKPPRCAEIVMNRDSPMKPRLIVDASLMMVNHDC